MAYRIDDRRAANIRTARKSIGMSQTELAFALGYETVTPIKRAERGPWPFSIHKHARLAKILRIGNPYAFDWRPENFAHYLSERRADEAKAAAAAEREKRERIIAETIEARRSPRLAIVRGWMAEHFDNLKLSFGKRT